MKKYLSFVLIFVFAFGLFFVNKSFIEARIFDNPFELSNYVILSDGDTLRVSAGGLVQTNGHVNDVFTEFFTIHSSSPVLVFAYSNGGVRVNNSSFEPYSYNNLRFISSSSFIISRAGSSSSDLSGSNWGRPYYLASFSYDSVLSDGLVIEYNTNIADNSVYNDTLNSFLDGSLNNPVFPGDLGSIENPIKNQTIGALNNVYELSDYQIRQINFQVGNFGVNPNLTKDYYFNFGWDTKTNTNVNLSQYSIKFGYAGIVNNGLTSQVINYSEIVPFDLTYNHTIMFTDLLKKSGIVPDTTYDEDLPIAWTWSELTVLMQPILIDSQGRYNVGDYTQVKFTYTGDTGSVITENFDINSDPTEGLKPSPNQNGTGTNYDPISKFNETTGKDIDPSSVDFSGVKSVLYDLQSTVTEVPIIFGTFMSFLPSWLISLIIAVIGLMVAVGLFKFMLEVIT